MNPPTFDDFINIVDADMSRPLRQKRLLLDEMRSARCYDLGDVLDRLPPRTVRQLVAERTNADGVVDIDAFGPFLIKFTIIPNPTVIGTTFLLAGSQPTPLTCIHSWSEAHGGIWSFDHNLPEKVVLNFTASCLCVIDDAESNHSENVEYVERDEARRRGHARRVWRASQSVRVISLSKTRKQYQGGSGPHQGGSHARPVQHVRVITDRLVTMKNGTQYRRRPGVVMVNEGVTRLTRVVK